MRGNVSATCRQSGIEANLRNPSRSRSRSISDDMTAGSILTGSLVAFLWQNGVTTDLTSILGGEPSVAFGINHHGAITGPVYLPQARGYLLVPAGN
jgi:uncharacterized membrane protein